MAHARRSAALLVCLLAVCLLATHPATAEKIVLKNGQTIQADSAWVDGAEIRYRRGGALFTLSSDEVQSVLADEAGGPVLTDPDLLRSRERLAAGDPTEALRLARLALFRQPGSPDAMRALAAAQLALGDAARARESAEAAIGLDPHSASSHELLGDALAELADFVLAREQYRTALELDPSSPAADKLNALLETTATNSGARFQLRYDGTADEPLGLAVLRVLDGAWVEYQKRLTFAPAQPVTVVLQTATSFRDTTRAPDWVVAWNDGTIRVPVMGVATPTPGLVRVLRHELAHSFVASRAGPSCPTWLHEGVAQWLEGRDPKRDESELAGRLASAKALPKLESLEGPFIRLSETAAGTAYAQSLSAVVHIVRLRGEAGLRRLLDALSEGSPAAEALPIAIGLSYGEFQRDWEAYLRTSTRGAGL